MDFDKISDIEYKHCFNNRLCFACGLPGHWKDTYNPTKIANLVPMPACQIMQTNNYRHNNCRHSNHRVHYGCSKQPPPFNPAAQSLQIIPYMETQPVNSTQHWQLHAGKYKHSHIVSEVSPSYTLIETNTTSQTDTGLPHQDSPVPQLLKDRPLD